MLLNESFLSDHGVGVCVDVQLVRHVDGVGVYMGFNYVDEANEYVFVEPSVKSRGDDDRHGCVCVSEGQKMVESGREREGAEQIAWRGAGMDVESIESEASEENE